MTTIADTLTNPAGTGVGGVVVRATLVAASEVLTGGGAIIRETEATTDSDGAWSLTLTPIDDLAVSDGAYYLVTADGHRWTIDVPDSGTHALDDVQVEPGPLPSTGATAAALAALEVLAILDTIVDARGDLIVATAADTVTRLPVGATDGWVLKVDSTQATGIRWAAGGGGAVDSVNGETGVVVLDAADVGAQPVDSDLTTIAGLTATTDNVIQSVASAWASRTPAQLKATLALVKGDVGLGSVDNTSDAAKPVSTATQTALDAKQPLDSDLTAIAGLTATTDNMIMSVASAWASRTPAQVKAALAIAQSDVSGLVAALALLAPLASPTLTGTVTLSGRQVSTPDTLTDAATIAVDASLGNDFKVTLGGNRTLGNPTNPTDGQKIVFAIRQDGTGSRTLALGADYRLGTDITAVTLSTAANKTDYLGVRYNSTDSKWDVIAFVKGY